MSRTQLLFAGLSTTMLAVAAVAADVNAVPRYRFAVGQELSLRSTSEFKYGEGDQAGAHGSKTDRTVWVVKANADGSFRLVIREADTFSTTHNGKTSDQPASTRLVYADIFPDGRVTPNRTIRYRGHPQTLFPHLPQNGAGVEGGWKATEDDETTAYKPSPQAGPGFIFEGVTDSPENKVYVASRRTKYTFDPAKGFVTK